MLTRMAGENPRRRQFVRIAECECGQHRWRLRQQPRANVARKKAPAIAGAFPSGRRSGYRRYDFFGHSTP
jgi:hypothetical protein